MNGVAAGHVIRCLVMIALAAACSADFKSGVTRCGRNEPRCPPGFFCGPDNHCYGNDLRASVSDALTDAATDASAVGGDVSPSNGHVLDALDAPVASGGWNVTGLAGLYPDTAPVADARDGSPGKDASGGDATDGPVTIDAGMACRIGEKLCPAIYGTPATCMPVTSLCETLTQCGDATYACRDPGLHVDCAVDDCVERPTCDVGVVIRDPLLTNDERACAVCALRRCCSVYAPCALISCTTNPAASAQKTALQACVTTFCRAECR